LDFNPKKSLKSLKSQNPKIRFSPLDRNRVEDSFFLTRLLYLNILVHVVNHVELYFIEIHLLYGTVVEVGVTEDRDTTMTIIHRFTVG
jgi:hypothetical protein